MKKIVPNQNQIDTAIALAKTASDTATALAAAKVQSDIVSAGVAKDIEYIKMAISDIKKTMEDISNRDDTFVTKDEFNFWRNLLVSGLLLSIVIGVIIKAL